ncbi:MAG: hypothetical protein HC790_12755, partial [Acaryochloridaceae cyanobacterium CSU_3_4]|nr:hypothetical protein [Acaryochloridaceae cyanobacterium CSU_3_4]
MVTLSASTTGILNGPQNQPAAQGPTDFNDDFTNLSTPVPAGQTGPFDPAAVTFTNTVSNPGTAFLANVVVVPVIPSRANTIDPGSYGADTDIPVDTTVTISYGGASAVYTYTFTPAVGAVPAFYSWVLTSGAPIVLDTQLLPGETQQYTVTVNLPAGTSVLDEVSVPIVAFPDTGAPGYTGETTTNITINRLYTGFMELIKEARILRADGVTEVQTWTQNITSEAQPGEFIEYRIRYRNISTAVSGSNSVTLSAANFKVLENGVDLPNN